MSFSDSHPNTCKFIASTLGFAKKHKNLYSNNDIIFHSDILVRSTVGLSGEDNIQYASLKKSIIILAK